MSVGAASHALTGNSMVVVVGTLVGRSAMALLLLLLSASAIQRRVCHRPGQDSVVPQGMWRRCHGHGRLLPGAVVLVVPRYVRIARWDGTALPHGIHAILMNL